MAFQRIQDFLEAVCMFFQYTVRYLAVSKKRIHNLCKDGIEKSVPHDQCLSSLGKPHVPISDPRDRFFYPTLTIMVDSYILYPCPAHYFVFDTLRPSQKIFSHDMMGLSDLNQYLALNKVPCSMTQLCWQ